MGGGGCLVVNLRGQDVFEWIWSVRGVVCEDPGVDLGGAGWIWGFWGGGVQYPGDVGGRRGFGVSRIDLGGPWVDLGDLGG